VRSEVQAPSTHAIRTYLGKKIHFFVLFMMDVHWCQSFISNRLVSNSLLFSFGPVPAISARREKQEIRANQVLLNFQIKKILNIIFIDIVGI